MDKPCSFPDTQGRLRHVRLKLWFPTLSSSFSELDNLKVFVVEHGVDIAIEAKFFWSTFGFGFILALVDIKANIQQRPRGLNMVPVVSGISYLHFNPLLMVDTYYLDYCRYDYGNMINGCWVKYHVSHPLFAWFSKDDDKLTFILAPALDGQFSGGLILEKHSRSFALEALVFVITPWTQRLHETWLLSPSF